MLKMMCSWCGMSCLLSPPGHRVVELITLQILNVASISSPKCIPCDWIQPRSSPQEGEISLKSRDGQKWKLRRAETLRADVIEASRNYSTESETSSSSSTQSVSLGCKFDHQRRAAEAIKPLPDSDPSHNSNISRRRERARAKLQERKWMEAT